MVKKGTLIYGVGINDADYKTLVQRELLPKLSDGKRRFEIIWSCPFYRKWKVMIERCYSEYYLKRSPQYRGCSVIDEWHLFSNFKSWMETQDWEGKQLDKDILFPRNKVYSPNTCCFVSAQINNFVVEVRKGREDNFIGAQLKVSGKYQAVITINSKSVALGTFQTAEEAHDAWLAEKLKQAYLICDNLCDDRLTKALIDRYTNYKEYFHA